MRLPSFWLRKRPLSMAGLAFLFHDARPGHEIVPSESVAIQERPDKSEKQCRGGDQTAKGARPRLPSGGQVAVQITNFQPHPRHAGCGCAVSDRRSEVEN